MITYKCKHCKKKLETYEDLAGQQESCPSCGKHNSVPNLASAVIKQQVVVQKREFKDIAANELLTLSENNSNARDLSNAIASHKPQFSKSVSKSKEIRPSVTEVFLNIMGAVCVIGSILVSVIWLLLAPKLVSKLEIEIGVKVLYAAATILSGFVIGVPFFALSLILQYLRRITNAAERKE